MDGVAKWNSRERQDLFTEAAARLGFGNPIVVEKDFWVCWVLNRVSLLRDQPRIVFKGGTSLSKVFGLIRRFSEDIDLAFHRHDLGFTGDRDPATPGRSGHRRKDLLASLKEASAQVVADRFLPALRSAALPIIGDEPQFYVDVAAPDTVTFEYPRSLSPTTYPAGGYVRPQVRLELGVRADHEPQVDGTVKPYAAELSGDLFTQPSCRVPTLAAERTFWEKATLLHERALRPQAVERERGSRHYYDVVVMSRSELGRSALARTDLLGVVARHKAVFFPVGGDVYSSARPGTLRLVPPDELRRSLRVDYGKMREMFFEDPPGFDELLAELGDLEARINA